MQNAFQGSLFTTGYLTTSIAQSQEWRDLEDGDLDSLAAKLRGIFERFPSAQSPNEAQTENDLIWPVLDALNWTASLTQQNLAPHGREDVPDGILFQDAAAKTKANKLREEWRRYEHGLAIVESKRWKRPLDRRSGRKGEDIAPSAQMLRYLRRVEDLTTGKLRWGILTNGARWRLYYQGTRSVAEEFFEADLPALLNIGDAQEDLFALSDEERRHWLRVFVLIFRKEAFLGTPSDPRTFHQRAREEGRFYEERVAADLSEKVFQGVFPNLARAIADAAPGAPLQEVREAALILLYRLLFIFYAEDRDLLPVRDDRYKNYGLRDKVRSEIGDRKRRGEGFSASAARYWSALADLCTAIDQGDGSIGLPPYNGGLFDSARTPLLGKVRLPDGIMADVIDSLSYHAVPDGERRYINYRDLSVQQLGSIYERLLEYEVIREDNVIGIRPNIFARKRTGSYYTPDDLVDLIIRETLEPLISDCKAAFQAKSAELAADSKPEDRRLGLLQNLDPAERLLALKICDPAMGSGHFLVALADYLTDQVIVAMDDAAKSVSWAEYASPLAARIETIRRTIAGNAENNGWVYNAEQLDDRHIIRRMILKRCIYGVDKNPMAVELAKVALWLHTFTVGAPLSFLDHHLRCGDSLFGLWARNGLERAPLFLHKHIQDALKAADPMKVVEGLTDAEIAEAHLSAGTFHTVLKQTESLRAMLDFFNAVDWMDLDEGERKLIPAFYGGVYGDPVLVVTGQLDPLERKYPSPAVRAEAERFVALLAKIHEFLAEERFLNWQVAYPGVWTDWEADGLHGGFDAVIGNPPWDRMKLQQVEWFAARRREIALAQRASDRKRMIAKLETAGDPLAKEFAKADARAETALRMARTCGDYPLLSGGDVNLYSLFVERAMTLAKPEGIVGLVTPSGIASDKTAAPFFKGVATEGRLKALYDFENRRTKYEKEPFFPDVDSRFKFCTFIASPARKFQKTQTAFFLQDLSELSNPERCFPLASSDFAKVNPNTGTAPVFRTQRDADLTTAIYSRMPVLVDRSNGRELRAWPVKYIRMFDMTNDSHLFRTRLELEEKEGAYPIGGNRFKSPSGDWLPPYEGKMVQAFDHRAASIHVNQTNQHRPAQPQRCTPDQSGDPEWLPSPQFWVSASACTAESQGWLLGFKEIASPTNVRTMISCIVPSVGFGNKLPILVPDRADIKRSEFLLGANLNSSVLDYVLRQKLQGQTINLFILEQLPIVPPATYSEKSFGKKTAAEIVKEAVLELTYTAHDMAPFARDMGYVDEQGQVKPPFKWDEDRRLRLRAKLDGIYFHLYGVTDRDDVRYIYSTFPIVERQEMAKHGRYLSRDLCLAWMSALAAGDPDAQIEV
ncbi:MAG: Eco57I restriction-modification methylase domain-containing protein [Rhodomicrobium sp.]